MADFRERYKRVGFGREDLDVNRVLRSQRREEARRELRSEHFSLRRDLGGNDDPIADSSSCRSSLSHDLGTQQSQSGNTHTTDDKKKQPTEHEVAVQQRLLELEKWQKERQRKKLQEKKKLKPAFKVGVVHHRVYSPPINKEPVPLPPAKLCRSKEIKHEEPPKRVTRATEKRLAAKAVASQQRREDIRNKKKVQTHIVTESGNVPFAPKDHQFKPPIGVTPLPMFGRHVADDGKENLKLESNIIEEPSLNQLTQNFSDLSDSVFINNVSSSTKITNRNSTLSKLNAFPCDSTNKSINDSLTNLSVETSALKHSSDDQDMLSNEEKSQTNDKANFSLSKSIKSPVKQRRSRNKSLNADLLETESMEIQENNINNESKLNSTVNSTRNKRNLRSLKSSKISVNEVSHSEKIIDDSFMSVDHEVDNIQDGSASASQSMLDNLNIIDAKLKMTMLNSPLGISNNNKSSNKRRSTRNLRSNFIEEKAQNIEVDTDPTEHKEKLDKEKKQFDISQQEISCNAPEMFEADTSISKQRRKKSQIVRRSSRVSKSNFKEENIKESFVKDSELSSINTEKLIDDISFTPKDSITNSSPPKLLTNSTLKRRKSSRIFNNENILNDSSIKEPCPVVQEQEFEAGRESIFDYSNKHLLDITLSDLNKIKPPKRKRWSKMNEMPLQEMQDQSLIKFSPRQSIRLQQKKLMQESSHEKTSTTSEDNPMTKSSEQDCISNAISNEQLNATTSFEQMNRRTSDIQINESQNFSLNLTLPEESLSDKPPVFYSPYVVTSRGKTNIRKEVKRRRHSHRVSGEIPTKDTVMQNLNISAEEEERTANYYKYILDKEIERLNSLCDSWNVIKEDESTPEDIRYMIQAAVGHTQLLINKKFQRFRGLVLDCETGKGEMLVTCKDLQGFWEMMYMEIKDVDNRFNKLEELKTKNWIEETEVVSKVKQPKKKVVKKAAPAKKNAVPAKSSSLRAHIMAARKKKLENNDNQMDVDVEVDIKQSVKANDVLKENVNTENKISENTPIKTRRTSTPKSISKRQSLINKVQSSAERNSVSSPLIVMKLSQMCKTPEVQLDDSIIYINSDRTPAKGILKPKLVGSTTKSMNKVIFKEHPMEIQEFEIEKDNSRSSNEFDDAVKEPIERRLDFENESFNSSDPKCGRTFRAKFKITKK